MRFSPPIVAIVVALVLTLAFWFLLYKPASDQQAVVESEIATLEDQQRTLQTQIDQLRDVEARQVEIRAALARLEEYIPSGPAQPTAIRQFQRASDAAGTEITTIIFGEPTVPEAAAEAAPADTGVPGTTLANIPVTMTIEGGYFQVVDFFRRLEVDVPRAALLETVDVEEAPLEGFPTLAATWTGQLFAVIPLGDLVDTAAGVPAPAPSPSPSPAAGG
jgi:Tfp pilus assembly protein PilO